MIVQQTIRPVAFLLLLGSGFTGPLFAQGNDGGLKLGDDAPAQPTLDLGARPAEGEASPPAEDTGPGIGTNRGPNAQAPDPSELVKHGDWEVYCPKAGEECLMAQLGTDSAGSRVLEMNIRQLPEPLEVDNEVAVAVLDVIVPLGVVLTAGLSISIDGAEPQFAPYQICLEQGCLVREPIAEELVDRLRKGGKALVTMVGANEGDVKSTLSLKGFTAAYSALK